MSDQDIAGQLRELADLHESGILTDEEFRLAKDRLLRSQHQDLPAPPTSPALPTSPAPPNRPFQHPAARNTTAAVTRPQTASTPAEPPRDHADRDPLEQQASAGGAWPAVGVVALSGSVLALLAFLAMPMVTIPFLGSITGAELAGMTEQEPSLALFWLVPVAAAIIAGISVWQYLHPHAPPQSHHSASFGSLFLSGAVTAAYLGLLAVVQTRLNEPGASLFGIGATDLAGTGFWLTIIGMLTAGAGATADLKRTGPVSRHDRQTDQPTLSTPAQWYRQEARQLPGRWHSARGVGPTLQLGRDGTYRLDTPQGETTTGTFLTRSGRLTMRTDTSRDDITVAWAIEDGTLRLAHPDGTTTEYTRNPGDLIASWSGMGQDHGNTLELRSDGLFQQTEPAAADVRGTYTARGAELTLTSESHEEARFIWDVDGGILRLTRDDGETSEYARVG